MIPNYNCVLLLFLSQNIQLKINNLISLFFAKINKDPIHDQREKKETFKKKQNTK